MFENLKEYYEYMDSNISLKTDINVSKKLGTISKLIDGEEKRRCLYEMYLIDFQLRDGEIVPQLISGESTYPNLGLFEGNYEYIIKRATDSDLRNPLLKARYNHVLWESPNKNLAFAKTAIDCYIEGITSIEIVQNDNISSHNYSLYFENLFLLSQKAGYKNEDVVNILTSELDSPNLTEFQKCRLIKYAVKKGKKVSRDQLNIYIAYLDAKIPTSLQEPITKEYLKLRINLCSRVNVPSKEFHNLLGDYLYKEAQGMTQSFAVNDVYLKALKQFQLASNQDRIEELTVLLEKLKDSLDFKSVTSEHESPFLQEWYDSVKYFISQLMKNGDSDVVYTYLITAPDLFPTVDPSTEHASTMMDLFNTISFDINRNISGDGKKGINQYYIHLDNFTLRQLWLIFTEGHNHQKINYDSLKSFIENKTWYGEEVSKKGSDGNLTSFKWSELLLPALESYFVQSKIDLESKSNNFSGYLLAIDSLTMKFEGVLREFSRRMGAQTIEIKDDSTEERISFEKLLDNPKLMSVIPEVDINLFKFLFTSTGINLRNNVAHCFYKPKNYAPSLMWLLICAFLKLGNYSFTSKEKEEEE
ncbi:MAG: hypothetical protein ACI9J3_000944 [Parvicellaceae bacterium]|jgi:hypothetical protein